MEKSTAPPPLWPKDVVMAGILRKYKSKKKKIQKNFHQFFFVLHSKSDSGANRLSFYRSESDFKCSDPEVGSISLENCLGVRFVRLGGIMDRCAFQVSTPAGSFVLGTSIPEYSARWIEAVRVVAFGDPLSLDDKKSKSKSTSLKQENSPDNIFPVTIKETKDATRMGFPSSGQLEINSTYLSLDLGEGKTITWPISGLRRYSRTPLMTEVLIEAGRRCGPQQGTYIFIGDAFSAIYDLIRKYANELVQSPAVSPRKDFSQPSEVDTSLIPGQYQEIPDSPVAAENDGYHHLIMTEVVYDLGDGEYIDVAPEDPNQVEDESQYDDVIIDSDEEAALKDYDNNSYNTDEPLYDSVSQLVKNLQSM